MSNQEVTQLLVLDELNPSKQLLTTQLKDGVVFNAIGDYSGGITDFKYTSTNDNTYITRLIMFYETDDEKISAGEYGGAGGLLNNGLKIYTKPSGMSKVYLNGDVPIIGNADFHVHTYDTEEISYGGGNEGLCSRWSFFKAASIRLMNGDEIGVEIDDEDFTSHALLQHYFTIQGYIKT